MYSRAYTVPTPAIVYLYCSRPSIFIPLVQVCKATFSFLQAPRTPDQPCLHPCQPQGQSLHPLTQSNPW